MAKTLYFGESLSFLKDRIKEGKGGAFIFYGEEELLKKFYLDKLIAMIEKEGMPDFNLARLDFDRKCTIGDIEDEAGILPCMAEHRLIIIRSLNITKLSNDDIKRLCAILGNTPEYLFIIIYIGGEEFLPDKDSPKKPYIKSLSEVCKFIPFPPQSEKTLYSWCSKILAADELAIADDAFRLLIDFTEGKMQAMKNELDKLIPYAIAKNKKMISKDDIILFVDSDPQFALYQLNDAVIIGDIAASEKMLASLKRHKAEPIVIVSSLSRAMVGAICAASGADPDNVQRGIGLREWQLNNLKRQVSGKKKEIFENALALCLEADKKLKGFSADPFILCEKLILDIIRLVK